MGLLNKVFSIGKRQPEQYICIEDRKYTGVNGGTFTNGAWRQRDLTTVAQDETGQALVSGNAAHLPPGSYRIRCRVPAYDCNGHVARLIDEETGHALLTGSPGYSANGTTIGMASFIEGKFRLASNRSIRVEHYQGNIQINNVGFGIAAGTGLTCEVYTRMELFRTTL